MKRRTLVLFVILVLCVGAGVWYGLSRKQVSVNSQTAGQTAAKATTNAQSSQSTTKQNTSAFDKGKYSIDDPASIWIVVNKQRPLNPKTYAPSDLTPIGNGQYMRAEAAQAFTRLVSAAKVAGYALSAESGYRSYDTQVNVYGKEVANYGQATADTESARPGYSEHQTGWAVDIQSPGCIEDCFGTTGASTWLLANGAKYGFIQRYAENKASITGYRHEPWHFRYVGPALAQEVVKSGQTLEEFFGLQPAPNY